MAHQLAFDIDIPADPGWVFQAWIDPEMMALWWWPHIPDTSYSIDPRVDGTYRIMSNEAGIGVRGTFTEVTAPTRIAMTWEWMDDGETSDTSDTVEIDITHTESGVGLVLTHHLDPRAGDGAELRQGWTDVLERLVALAHG